MTFSPNDRVQYNPDGPIMHLRGRIGTVDKTLRNGFVIVNFDDDGQPEQYYTGLGGKYCSPVNLTHAEEETPEDFINRYGIDTNEPDEPIPGNPADETN